MAFIELESPQNHCEDLGIEIGFGLNYVQVHTISNLMGGLHIYQVLYGIFQMRLLFCVSIIYQTNIIFCWGLINMKGSKLLSQ